MENSEQNSKVGIAAKVDPAVFAAISEFAVKEDRSISYIVDRLLKESPQIQRRLEQEAGVAA